MHNGDPDASGTPLNDGAPLTNAKGRRICGADRGRDRGRCKSTFLFKNGRCKVHNGNAKSGPANPNWKHGHNSQWMPADVLAAAEREMQNPRLKDAELTIALMNRFMQEEAGKAAKAKKPETREARLRSFGDVAVKRSRVLAEDARRTRYAHDSIGRGAAGRIMAAFGQAVRDVIMRSANVTDARALLVEIKQEWDGKRSPLRTAGAPAVAISGEADQAK